MRYWHRNNERLCKLSPFPVPELCALDVCMNHTHHAWRALGERRASAARAICHAACTPIIVIFGSHPLRRWHSRVIHALLFFTVPRHCLAMLVVQLCPFAPPHHARPTPHSRAILPHVNAVALLPVGFKLAFIPATTRQGTACSGCRQCDNAWGMT